ncbi:MAG: hypothetical protein OXU36_16920 [Candidatus Poribacteria bacterium]|nr:hypothetical protein [Candidatus Poribacteria bacterium]
MKQKKRNWYVFFRKITLIFAGIAAVVGFIAALPTVNNELMRAHADLTILFALILIPAGFFFAVWGVYYVLYILYCLFRWAWKSTESDTTDP